MSQELLPRILTYQAEYFVDREREIDQVKKIVERTKAPPGSHRIIQIHAPRGSGKSFFTRRLVLDEYRPPNEVEAYLINFTDNEPENKSEREFYIHPALELTTEYEKIAEKIIDWLALRLELSFPDKLPVIEKGQLVVQGVQRGGDERKRYFLILDSLFDAEPELLKVVESTFLAGLAKEWNVAVLMTGRAAPPTWASGEMRFNIEEIKLEAFSPEAIGAQLRKLPETQGLTTEALAARVQAVLALGCGFPLSNYLLGRLANPEKALNDAINIHLMIIPTPSERMRLRRYLEAISPLEGFREEEIRQMIAEYQTDEPTGVKAEMMSIGDVRVQVRDPLIKYHLIYFDGKRFLIDPAIQPLLQHYLRQEKPAVWKRLNQRAHTLYEKWSHQYPKEVYYQQRAEWHNRMN